MTSCIACVHAKPFAGPDGRIDFSRKLCKEGPPTPVIVGVDATGRAVVQYIHPVVSKDMSCDRIDPRLIGEASPAKPEGSATQ